MDLEADIIYIHRYIYIYNIHMHACREGEDMSGALFMKEMWRMWPLAT